MNKILDVFPSCKHYSMAKRHTISITCDVYTRLRNKGRFGESFTDVILHLLNVVEKGTQVKSADMEQTKGADHS